MAFWLDLVFLLLLVFFFFCSLLLVLTVNISPLRRRLAIDLFARSSLLGERGRSMRLESDTGAMYELLEGETTAGQW